MSVKPLGGHMVFRDVQISVSVQDAVVVFRFAVPLSVISLTVATPGGEDVWELLADELKPMPEPSESSFRVWPIDQAPPEMLKILSEIQKREDRRLQTEGPRKPRLAEITYGEVPEGYREEQSAAPLKPGEYGVIVFAEQGQGTARFSIPHPR